MTRSSLPNWPDDDVDPAELLDRLVAAGVVGTADSARLVTDGMQHVVLIVDERLVARFARTPAAARSLRTEAALLDALRDHVTVPLPTPVHVDDVVAVHPMLHGAITTRAAIAAMSSPQRDRLIDDTARLLTELATAPTADTPASDATASRERFTLLRERADRVVHPLLWRHQRRWYDDLFRRADEIPFDHTPTIIHGDLAPYHVLHDPGTGALTGILDFGVAGVGDPAVDLACLMSTWGHVYTAAMIDRQPDLEHLIARAGLIAAALPLEWSTIALEQGAADMAVAHLGHLAVDLDH